MLTRILVPLVLLISVGALPGCSSQPNVLSIVMDTVRQQDVSSYGYERATTPHLERFARGAMVFDNAFAVGPWKTPNHASIFTGLYSVQHGAIRKSETLREELVTLAEVLAEDGYETAAFVNNGTISRARGFAELRPRILKREKPLPLERIELLKKQYDTAIFNVDTELRGLFKMLANLGIYDDTMIVLTSDHGEFFGEHDLIDPGKDVYDPVLRVPIIIKNPGQLVGRIDETVIAGTDIPHLILSQLPQAMAQRNLAGFSRGPDRQTVLGESHFTMAYDVNRNPWARERFDRVRTAVIEWPYKIIHDSTGRHELYELEQLRALGADDASKP